MSSEYGWNPQYGNEPQTAIVVSPKLGLAKENQLDLLLNILPREMILKKWGMPYPRFLTRNGIMVSAISATAIYDGRNNVLCWCDEIHRPAYVDNPASYTNYVARLRDPMRKAKHTRMWVSGLPTSGWVRDKFEVKEPHPQRRLSMWDMDLNTKLDQSLKDEIMHAAPDGDLHFLKGVWQAIPNALYPQYNEDVHLVDDEGNPRAPVSVGIDVGTRSAVVIAQRQPVPGSAESRLHVVDEILGDGITCEVQCRMLKESKWRLEPGRSTISCDPTIRGDEKKHIYAAFPGVQVVIRDPADELHSVIRGVRLVQARLRAADGSVRITVNRKLAAARLGVVASFLRMQSNPLSGAPKVDDYHDHPNDALRYLACTELGRQVGAPTASRR
jgi:hypothetical protein